MYNIISEIEYLIANIINYSNIACYAVNSTNVIYIDFWQIFLKFYFH